VVALPLRALVAPTLPTTAAALEQALKLTARVAAMKRLVMRLISVESSGSVEIRIGRRSKLESPVDVLMVKNEAVNNRRESCEKAENRGQGLAVAGKQLRGVVEWLHLVPGRNVK
jgi:hypothetical protein